MGSENTDVTQPLVSVIMPAYNCEKYIEIAIRSVITQTYQNWELLVIDDGSTDTTPDIVKALSLEDPRIQLIANPENLGVAKTRNKGFELSNGGYVALLDCDDVWLPEKLEKQVSLAQNTGVDIIYCSYSIVDETGKKICADFIVPDKTSYEEMLIKSVISCSTALLSRTIIENYSFRTDYYHEDFLLWLELMRDQKSACGVVDVLAEYRILCGSRSSNKLKTALGRWKIYRQYMKVPFFKSIKLIMQYAFLAVSKYRRI